MKNDIKSLGTEGFFEANNSSSNHLSLCNSLPDET